MIYFLLYPQKVYYSLFFQLYKFIFPISLMKDNSVKTFIISHFHTTIIIFPEKKIYKGFDDEAEPSKVTHVIEKCCKFDNQINL